MKRIAKFWVEQLGNLWRRIDSRHNDAGKPNYPFVAHVYYRNKSGKLDCIWGGFSTYDEACEWTDGTEFTYKTGRKVHIGWDSKQRVGFIIEGDKGNGYKLLAYCMPFELQEMLEVIKSAR